MNIEIEFEDGIVYDIKNSDLGPRKSRYHKGESYGSDRCVF
jgi:hypothetical protein